MNGQLISLQKIWDLAPHNALTDLARFRNVWYCAFREGAGHVSPEGRIRILASGDGIVWAPLSLLAVDGLDLRDPKLSITPAGSLMLNAAAAYPRSAPRRHQSMVWFFDGSKWSPPAEIGAPDVWLWRVTWHCGMAYAIGYRTADPPGIGLFTSSDGAKYHLAADDLYLEGWPNEATLAFDRDRTGFCLLRREAGAATAQLGRAAPPFLQWEWKDCGVRIGGPHMIFLPDGRLIAAVRRYGANPRTSLNRLNPDSGEMTEFLSLPSGGDTSYAGLCWHEGTLWVSYYSSHEERTSIYLAQVGICGED
jgi:hypothetical protein